MGLFSPPGQAPDLREAKDVRVIVTLCKDEEPGDGYVRTQITALDELEEGEEGLNINGDNVFEALVYALYHHFVNEHEVGHSCCLTHFIEEITDLLERVNETDGNEKVSRSSEEHTH